MNSTEEITEMPAEIDFSDSIPNPYVGRTRRRITINVDGDTVDYFKAEARRTGVPYQTIMNLYLSECAAEEKRLSFV